MSEIDDISDALGSVFLQWRESAVGFVFSHHFSFDETLNNFFEENTTHAQPFFVFFVLRGVALISLLSFFSLLLRGFISAHTHTRVEIGGHFRSTVFFFFFFFFSCASFTSSCMV